MSVSDCSKSTICGVLAIISVVVLAFLIKQHLDDTKKPTLCASNGSAATRAIQMDADGSFRTGTARTPNVGEKAASINEFMVAQPKEPQGQPQDEATLSTLYSWDENIPKEQSDQLSLDANYKTKAKMNANILALSSATSNAPRFSKSIGSTGSMLTLHQMTGSNGKRKLDATNSIPWGYSEAYMSELNEL